MALTLFSSNRVETLQRSLSLQLGAAPLRDPFAPEVIVVPTYAMGRWLNLRIAQQQGIAANIRYPQPAQWIWQLATELVGNPADEDSFAPESLGWLIFSRLPALLRRDSFSLPAAYLDGDDNGLRRWQLAERIASLFDRYQLYRPRQMRDWAAGAEDHWQADLWRDLLAATPHPPRAEIIADAIRLLAEGKAVETLPERVSLFAPSSFAPIMVEFIHALAGQTEILLFHHSPSDQYWADLQSDKARARERLLHPDADLYADRGHGLLATWGRQGQAMQDLLLDLGPVTRAEIDLNHPPGAERMLQALQNGLFTLDDAAAPGPVDDSISLHLCHSPMRECQVLHDWLLALLERHAELGCEDVLVMVPEIDRYAPYIEAVFQADTGGQRPDLPWNISDISVGFGHPVVAMFLQMLRLPGSRFTRSEVMAYLECEAIRDRFGIDEAMRETIQDLVESARVRWGIDARQRAALGLPAMAENTWQQAWDRLFCGFAVDSDMPWRDIAPISGIDRDSAIALSRFRYLFERLVHWQQRLARDLPASEWQQLLHELVDEFFTPRAIVEDEQQPLRDAIRRLGNAATETLSPALIRYWMTRQLGSTHQPGRLYSGGITFCGMQPMRNIPFPVIAVLGMQEEAFPRRNPGLEFDLMHSAWRPGDPHPGDEDRYLMLETLLCARRYLYFSYCARSLKDNSECQPSPLLRELLDHLDEHFVRGEEGRAASAAISHEHPMQAFSPRNFITDPPAAFDRGWCDTATQLLRRGGDRRQRPWPDEPLAPLPDFSPIVDLERLLQFFRHPVRYFFSQRFGVRIPDETQIEDVEDFSLDGLQKWQLVMRTAESLLQGQVHDLHRARAEGFLPHGAVAEAEWQALQLDYGSLFDALDAFRHQRQEARPVDCELDHGRGLAGEVRACYPGVGLVHFSASKIAKARPVLTLWLNHLALCASGRLAADETSRLILPRDKGVELGALEPDRAAALLRLYLDLYAEGQLRPLPLILETSFAYAREDDPDTALRKARSAWEGGDYPQAAPGEHADSFYRAALHNGVAEPLGNAEFRQLARQVYGPLLDEMNNHA